MAVDPLPPIGRHPVAADARMTPRIIHILRAPVGGLFRHVRDLAGAQVAAGWHVGVIADASGGDALTEGRLAALSPSLALGLHRVAMSRDLGPRDVTAVIAVSRLLRSRGATVAHGHGAKGGAYARLAARLLPVAGRPRVVYTPHGGSLHYRPASLMGRIYMALERRLAPLTDGVIFESAYSARLYGERVACEGLAVRVVPNGLAAAEFEPVLPDPDARHFLFVGELRRLKGVDLLLEAVAALRRGGRPATAMIVGDGPDRAMFEAQAVAHGLADDVMFAGAMPARAAFRRGRVLVVPSRAESFPYIVLEGAAAGLPLVATEVGGIPEIVAGTDTRLVPADDVAALERALRRAFDDMTSGCRLLRNEAMRLREAVRIRFTVERMAADVADAYRGRQAGADPCRPELRLAG